MELTLIDTNVLVYASDNQSQHHAAAKRVIDATALDDASYCVAPQTIAEFFAISTNPRRVRHPLTASEALRSIETLLERPGITLLPVPTDVVQRWTELVRTQNVTGPLVFDLQLAATMLGNGVKKICTFNVTDFEKLPGIEVVPL